MKRQSGIQPWILALPISRYQPANISPYLYLQEPRAAAAAAGRLLGGTEEELRQDRALVFFRLRSGQSRARKGDDRSFSISKLCASNFEIRNRRCRNTFFPSVCFRSLAVYDTVLVYRHVYTCVWCFFLLRN